MNHTQDLFSISLNSTNTFFTSFSSNYVFLSLVHLCCIMHSALNIAFFVFSATCLTCFDSEGYYAVVLISDQFTRLSATTCIPFSNFVQLQC